MERGIVCWLHTNHITFERIYMYCILVCHSSCMHLLRVNWLHGYIMRDKGAAPTLSYCAHNPSISSDYYNPLLRPHHSTNHTPFKSLLLNVFSSPYPLILIKRHSMRSVSAVLPGGASPSPLTDPGGAGPIWGSQTAPVSVPRCPSDSKLV